MDRLIGLVTLLVADYDDAIAFYVDRLEFVLAEDTPLGGGKRWVIVRPPGASGTGLLLAQAADDQRSGVGAQAGGRVFLFLHTDDFWRDYDRARQRGVGFLEAPRNEPYGWVAVFADLYGNLWDLIEKRDPGADPPSPRDPVS